LIQDNEYKEINIVRKIRNEFGHTWKGIDFKCQKIVDLCAQLPFLGPEEYESEQGSNFRLRFDLVVVFLLFDLIWRARLVNKEKREIKIWPNRIRG
jgi:hypothetical protein